MKNLKTISSIFTLIFGGILAGGYVNAMTYNINGDYTQIIIPINYSSGTTINRGEENSETSMPQSVISCEELPSSNEIDEPVYKCEHIYTTSGYYEIRIENQNEKTPSKISIDSGNVTDIKNFSGFGNLTEIYLRNNKLNTIPPFIWEARNQIKTIKLSDTVQYYNESGTKYIDLKNNPIEFIGLTKIGNYNLSQYESELYPNFHNATEYNFEWFGFSANNNITYDYNINDILGNSTQISNYTGITNTGISINTQLNNGTYYFKTCIHNTKICEGEFFTVNYDELIYFTGSTYPASGETLSTTNNIEFFWERSGNVPDEYISGYSYTLIKNGTPILEGFTGNNSYTLDSAINNPNGNYIFTVTLINSDGSIIASIERHFTILIPTLSINLQNLNETSSSIQFDRDYYLPSPYVFSGYIYTITKGNDIIKNGTIDTLTDTGLKVNNLDNGNYIFTIAMEYLNNGKIESIYDTKSFTITKETNTSGRSSSHGSTTKSSNTTGTTLIYTDNTNTNSETSIIDTKNEIYIARNCKEYTIEYSESLNAFTSPDLKIKEYFINKDYFKRYIDSKNPHKIGCPTNVGWISTYYIDRSNDNNRYIAPNGKVYFIIGEEGNYYSNELNKEIRTPKNFKNIQKLKYYIRDRNPLISMGYLGSSKELNNSTNTIKTNNKTASEQFDELFNLIWDKSGTKENKELSYVSSDSIKVKRKDGIEGSLFTFDNPNIGLKKISIRRNIGDERYILSKRDNGKFELDSNENGKTVEQEYITENNVINDILPVFRKYLENSEI